MVFFYFFLVFVSEIKISINTFFFIAEYYLSIRAIIDVRDFGHSQIGCHLRECDKDGQSLIRGETDNRYADTTHSTIILSYRPTRTYI